MKTLTPDVAVIGAGTAGLAAYRAAKAAGASVLMIEGGDHGTTCARVGCMPSKLLIAAAEAAHAAQHTAPFGVHVDGDVRIDGREVMARVKRERDRFVGFVVDSVLHIPAEDRLEAFARFTAPMTLQVGEDTIVKPGRIVIATGSAPAVPPPWRALGDRLVVNDDVFYWDDLPRRVAVFGPGVIGLELGQALARLGVTMRLFGKGKRIGPLSDAAIIDAAADIFGAEFPFSPDADVTDIRREGDEVVITYIEPGMSEPATERFDYLLAATGRKPNLGKLALEQSGLALDKFGVPEFDAKTLQCGTQPVFIAGDVNNIVPLLHEAADEGKTAGHNAGAWPRVTAGLRRAPISVVFSEPQIAMVGKRFSELEPGSFVVGEIDFADQGRSRVMLKNAGLMHVYADVRDGEFLGAEWLGPRAENIAHLLAWAVQQRLSVAEMLDMPFYHPVVEEGLRTALRDAAAKLAKLSPEERACAQCEDKASDVA